MTVKIIVLIIFIILSICTMMVHIIDKNCTKHMLLTGFGLWILGLYIGLIIATFYK